MKFYKSKIDKFAKLLKYREHNNGKNNMELKKIGQHFLGRLRCIRNGVSLSGRRGIYIGRNVHFVNGSKIKLGNNISVRPDCDLFADDIFAIGDNSDIGTRNRIVGDVIIGKSVLFGPDNYICSKDHCYKNIGIPIMNQGAYSPNHNGHKELMIGDGSWIGTHVAIIGDVHIGRNCVIGANSVVTKDIPDYCVAVGNPARIIKKFDLIEKRWKQV